MMAVLMGVRDRVRLAAAINLGVAMQLSNIARDVGEDACNGRIYLPLDWLSETGIDPDRFLQRPRHGPALGSVVSRLLHAADEHYRHAAAGITRFPSPAGSASAPLGCSTRRSALRLPAGAWIRCPGRAVVSGGARPWFWPAGLPRMVLPLQPLSGVCVAEGEFLVAAVVQSVPLAPLASTLAVVAHVCDRPIDLFERLKTGSEYSANVRAGIPHGNVSEEA